MAIEIVATHRVCSFGPTLAAYEIFRQQTGTDL